MTTSRFNSILAAVFGAVLFLGADVSTALAQQQTPQATALLTPNVKEYGRPGYPVMTVYVWGDADTGVWSVEEGTDLLEFVSVISRVQFGDRRPDERSVQRLQLYRDGRTEGTPFYESTMEDLFTERGEYPSLLEGDILVLETTTRNRFTWRDIREVVGTAAIFLNTYLLLDRLND
jgi:hypothetical protein